MKKLALSILAAAAAIDIVRDPHSRTLVEDMLDAASDQSLAAMLAASPILAKIEYWAASLILFSIVSLLLGNRGRPGPDIIGR